MFILYLLFRVLLFCLETFFFRAFFGRLKIAMSCLHGPEKLRLEQNGSEDTRTSPAERWSVSGILNPADAQPDDFMLHYFALFKKIYAPHCREWPVAPGGTCLDPWLMHCGKMAQWPSWGFVDVCERSLVSNCDQSLFRLNYACIWDTISRKTK